MTEFEFLAIGISLILGLGATTLLTSLLAAFVARRRIHLDWIPFAWASYILAIQVQYYAASWALNTRTEWTNLTFAAPLLLAGLIFVAAGLVLPSRYGDSPFDLRVYFEQNGKWAVAALALRAVAALLTNHFVFRSDVVFNVVDGMLLAQVAAALFFLFSKRRVLQVVSTLLYGFILFRTMAIIHL